MNGIDISNWQAGLDISALDVDFVICKGTEGVGYTDPTCNNFVEQCKSENLLWGFYHFARENEPEEEAEYFYNECKGYFNQGIPVLDYETENYDNCEWCERFIQRLYELSGVWCMIYISAYRCSQYEGSWIPEKCGLWVAGYPYTITTWTDESMPYNIYPWEFAAIWQFTSSLIIPGFWEKLDGDIAYMDSDAWYKYSNSDKPIPSKTIDDLAHEVILGEYGNGETRKYLLGDNYDKVQNRVNELYEIANEVIDGKWGNGKERMKSLEYAGYPYNTVQLIVNNILGE